MPSYVPGPNTAGDPKTACKNAGWVDCFELDGMLTGVDQHDQHAHLAGQAAQAEQSVN